MGSSQMPVPPTANPSSTEELPAGDHQPQGILLYYKYVELEGNHAQEVAHFYEELCRRLDLCGRIRVARDGVNVTVGGPMVSLRSHIAAVEGHPLLRGGDIDFKLAPSHGSRNDATRHETKMDTLVVRLCEELVTLGPLARNRADPRVNTAPHLTPEQFHSMLERAAGTAAAEAPAAEQPPTAVAAGAATAEASTFPAAECRNADAGSSNGGGGGGDAPLAPVVLLDARNVYETRIGHFDAGPSVPTVDPRTRCFSDLPAWMDAHEEALRNRTVLMYCTGGVRCERASAYLREKGPAFSRVFQLSGGIQRYLERFPDGGFFRGKNFLYDDRIAVGPEDVPPQSDGAVVGRCLLCDCPWDDYGARYRCSRCRLLLLVCDSCTAAERHRQEAAATAITTAATAAAPCASADGGEQGPQAPPAADQVPRGGHEGGGLRLLCELCRAAGGDGGGMSARVGGGGPSTTAQPADAALAGQDAVLQRERAAAAPQPEDQQGDAAGDDLCTTASTAVVRGVADNGAAGCRTRQDEPPDGPVGTLSSGAATQGPAAATPVSPSPPPPRLVGGDPCACDLAMDGVAAAAAAAAGPRRRRLRILCLHGFRQTGKQFQGRTCALRKKLRDLADFVFVDAPHALPLFVKTVEGRSGTEADVEGREGAGVEVAGGCDNDRRGGGVGGRDDQGSGGSDAGGGGGDGHDDSDGGGGGDGVNTSDVRQCGSEDVRSRQRQQGWPAGPPAAAKRAWLLPPELYGTSAASTAAAAGMTEAAPSYVDELQYTRQTEGWRESLCALQRAVWELGPFDGVFGFSQGAAVAAVLCAVQQQQRRRQQGQAQQEEQGPLGDQGPLDGKAPEIGDTGSEAAPANPGAATPCPETTTEDGNPAGPSPDVGFGFRFAILASGFLSPVRQHRDLLAEVGPLELPSLHVYGSASAAAGATAAAGAGVAAGDSGSCGTGGGGGGDRQIPPRDSELLAASFACGRRRSLRHQCGHLIPATRSHAATFQSFLEHFT